VENKIKALKHPKSSSVRKVLIYCGELSNLLEMEQYFDRLISADELLKLKK